MHKTQLKLLKCRQLVTMSNRKGIFEIVDINREEHHPYKLLRIDYKTTTDKKGTKLHSNGESIGRVVTKEENPEYFL